VSTLNSSHGGGFRTFRIHRYEGEAELEATPGGLLLTIRDDLKEVAAIQLFQWDQVEAWMEAARGADHDSAADIMSALAFGKVDEAFGDD
jgi:hypothetical protein